MQFTYTAKSSCWRHPDRPHRRRRRRSGEARAPREVALPDRHSRRRAPARGGRSSAGRADKTAMRKRDLLTVTTQLAIMTKSGVDLASAFESLAKQSEQRARPQSARPGSRRRDRRQGVSEAMRAQADVFGDAYVASVAAGEAAGQLPEVLGRLAELQRSEIRNRADDPHAAGLSDLAGHDFVARGVGPGAVRAAAVPEDLRAIRSAVAGGDAGARGHLRRAPPLHLDLGAARARCDRRPGGLARTRSPAAAGGTARCSTRS